MVVEESTSNSPNCGKPLRGIASPVVRAHNQVYLVVAVHLMVVEEATSNSPIG